MTDNERIAKFMGWKEIQDPDEDETVWETPEGYLCLSSSLPFITNMNLFVEAWNKAINQFQDVAGPSLPPNHFDESFTIYSLLRWNEIYFTIEKKLPLLMRMIDFLNNTKQ